MYRYRHVCLHIGIMAICGHSVYITVKPSKNSHLNPDKSTYSTLSPLPSSSFLQEIEHFSCKKLNNLVTSHELMEICKGIY